MRQAGALRRAGLPPPAMNPEEIEAFALSLPGAQLSIKWGDHRVYVVAEKMFAMLGGPSGDRLNFKCSDLSYEMLTQREGIVPAPYMARMKWVQLERADAMDRAEIEARLLEAHRIVVSKLPKKKRPPGF